MPGNDDQPISMVCGCGKPGKYVIDMNTENERYSCNKYERCLTRDEIKKKLQIANTRLCAYRKAINKIDDYFEYRHQSNSDQKKVHQILGNLTDSLSTL